MDRKRMKQNSQVHSSSLINPYFYSGNHCTISAFDVRAIAVPYLPYYIWAIAVPYLPYYLGNRCSVSALLFGQSLFRICLSIWAITVPYLPFYSGIHFALWAVTAMFLLSVWLITIMYFSAVLYPFSSSSFRTITVFTLVRSVSCCLYVDFY